MHWPSAAEIWQVVSLSDYNTRVILSGTVLLGVTAGLVGTFMLLRRQALVGDVVSHASLPGIAIAFLIQESLWPGSGRSFSGLLAGGLFSGVCGVLFALLIRRTTRVKEDAALAVVLSVLFGLGIALFTVIQQIPAGNVAGLNTYIYGKAASLLYEDVQLIAGVLGVVVVLSLLFFKELSLVCFDEEFAASQGWPVVVLDVVLTALIVIVTVIGLQSVGLLLVVAMLIIPPAAARFWTTRLTRMTLLAAGLGGLSAGLGVTLSALFPRLAAGSVIVLAGSLVFLISLLAGTNGGAILRIVQRRQLESKISRHDLLRAFFECISPVAGLAGEGGARQLCESAVTPAALLERRSWDRNRLTKLLDRAEREQLIRQDGAGFRLTHAGAVEARRVARNHRLWELYLITHADIAPSHVDRVADEIEHILDPEVLDELETLLAAQATGQVPPNPHD